MSGFAMCYGQDDGNIIRTMMDKIPHRGNYLKGVSEKENGTLGQNYLQADTRGASPDAAVPVSDTELVIGYDGQINDALYLAERLGLEDGPFLEERIILHLYRHHRDDIFNYLVNAIYAFVIIDGTNVFAARDPLGIKTLFYTNYNNRLLFASELKCIAAIVDDVEEFPAGYIMDQNGLVTRFGDLSTNVELWKKDVDTMTQEIREIIEKNIRSTVDFSRPTGGLLSGGMDSSVINLISAKIYNEKCGHNGKLKTFSIGVGESGDILNARLMSEFIDSEHHEILVTIDDLIKALPDVIYYLENFDPSLVRSSVANYLISSYAAKEHDIEILLSGEGGDEIFCGYTYLKKVPYEEMLEKQLECLSFLHNNASHRLDRMNQCHSVKVVAPLISGELLDYALKIPPQYKQYEEDGTRVEKWIFRKAYENLLPPEITKRLKQEFSQGSGSAGVMPAYFDDKISDSELATVQEKYPIIRSKEECYYFKLFTDFFGDKSAVRTVGQWVSL